MYSRFVNKEIQEEINRILGSRKWPTVIGKESFIDWVKGTFFFYYSDLFDIKKTWSTGTV